MTFAAHPLETRAEARRLYEAGEMTVKQIEGRVGVSRSTLVKWAAKEGWRRPAPATQGPVGQPTGTSAGSSARRSNTRTGRSRPASARALKAGRVGLVQRLYGVIDRNLNLLESRMSDIDPADPAQPDRDTRALGTLVRSLEKLKELEPGHDSTTAAPKSGRAPATAEEEDQLRMRIVERALKLRERRGPDGRDR
jgi:hypothetical protein